MPLNLDTLATYLERRFPDRTQSSRGAIGELADELLQFGYTTISALEDMLARSDKKFKESEKDKPPGGSVGDKFLDVGVVRVSLGILDPSYDKFIHDKYKRRSAARD